MSKQLNVKKWKDMEIWEIDQIPYLFLGYEPVPYNFRPLDDVTTLDEQESELYDQYFNLIRVAIDIGKLTPVQSSTARTTPLRAVEIKEWRKTKQDSIKPVPIYLKMEEEIQVPDTADNSVKSKTIPNQEPKPYNPRHEIYKKVYSKISLLKSTTGWRRAVEIVGLERKEGYVMDNDGHKVTEKRFQDTYSEKFRPLLPKSKDN